VAAIPANHLTKPYAVYRLNTARGITNIGSHPDNDIVIQDPAVLPFHLMLDHRQKPYQVYILSPEADVCINGVRLSGGEAKAVYDFSQIQFGGYTLRAQEGGGDASVEEVAVIPLDSLAITRAIPSQNPVASISLPDGPTAIPAAGRLDEIILLNLAEPQAVVNVEQTAAYTLTVINGGPIVATFDLTVEGVPQEWVEIQPARLNLYEGGRAAFEIRITAPRDPTSQAKAYPLRLVASSPNYPGLVSAAQAGLTINPYDEYVVGNMAPRSQSAAWGKKSAEASFTVTNYGNHPAGFRVSALDEENGCQFSFPQPGQATLVKQAEIQVEPGDTVSVPVVISPVRRSLVRLQARQYLYTVTTQSLVDPASTRSISGTFISRPLFGLFSVILAVALLAVGGYFLFKPRIDSFGVKAKIIRLGEPAMLQWSVSPFTSNLQISGIADPIKAGQNQLSTVPANTATTYTLMAGNWLSNLLHMDIHSQPVSVLAIPSYPEIDTFITDSTSLFQGDNLTVKWATKNATEAFLTIEGVTESLKPEEFSGQRIVAIKNNTLVVLQAKNASGTVERSTYIVALKPSAKLVNFDVTPQTVTKGDPVTISWEVTGNGVQSVMISPFTDPLPNTGKLTFFPDASMEFVLTVKSRGDQQLQPELRSVGVLSAPAAPKINIFNVIPNKLTIPGNVEVSWSVTGATTDIVLTSLDGEIAHGLPAQGFRSVPITKTTSLILTAYNGKLSDAQSKDVEYSTLKPVQVVITNVTPNTGLLLGDKVLVQFTVSPLDGSGHATTAAALGYPELSGKVDVTNGFDNCDPVPELPATSCQMTLSRITGQPIQATYSGDANYARTTSSPFTGYVVSGNPAVLTTHYTFGALHGTNLVVGEPFTIGFTFSPFSPVATTPVTGKVDVSDVTGGKTTVLCQNIELANTDKNNPLNASGTCPMAGFAGVGQKTLKFVFKDSPAYASTPPVDTSLYVGKADTVVSYLYDLSAQTVVGQSFPVTVIVRPKAPGGGTPTGKVSVWDAAYDNPDNSCNPMVTLDNQGKGACNLTLWHASPLDPTDVSMVKRVPKTLEATYSGDTNFNISQAEDKTHAVNPAPTSVTLNFNPSSGPQAAQVGQTLGISFKVSAAGDGAGSPAGGVHLKLSGSDVSQCSINYPIISQCSLTLPANQSLSLQGFFNGSADYLASDSGAVPYQVFPAETVIQAAAVPASVAGAGDTVTINASVATKLTSGITPTGTITVQGDQPVAGESQTCAYAPPSSTSCSIQLIGQGPRTITVSFAPNSGDTNFQPSATTLPFRIKRSVNLNFSTYQTSPIVGQKVAFNYSVSPVDSQGGTPTQIVTITAVNTVNHADVLSCSADLSAGACTIQFAKAASYGLTAHYSGDDIFASKDYPPTPASISISPATTQIPDLSLSRDINNIHVGDVFNVTFQVLNIDSSPIPSGTAYVLASTTNFCSPVNKSQLTSGQAVTINALGIGTVLNLSFGTSGPWYINVYFTDPNGNYRDSCFAKPINVNP
jgi:hypothetical protein